MTANQQEAHLEYLGCMHHHEHISNALPSEVGNVEGQDQDPVLLENNKDESLNNCVGDDKIPHVLRGNQGQIEGGREEYETLWQRMKWTDEMVKLLITSVSYLGEDALSCHDKTTSSLILPKKGKWRAISHVMVERGYHVSPQQCEDKFNDLNKKYRRLNDILGRGIACKVVENPSLMESMNLSEEVAEEVIRILGCKQLFFKELCSYHNGNLLFLPHDLSLQRSLYLALKGKGNCEFQEVIHELSAKRKREGDDHEIVGSRDAESEMLPDKCMTSRLVELEERKLKFQEQRLELEKKRLKWLGYSQQKDWELEKMRLENKMLKLQNQRFAFQLKYQKKGST